jgi:hypothetical protein
MSQLFSQADIEKMMGANLFGLLGVTPSSTS